MLVAGSRARRSEIIFVAHTTAPVETLAEELDRLNQ
jgi:hypothetical protein